MRTYSKTMVKALREHGDRPCELCLRKKKIEAHHIIPLSYGGKDIPENIICICEQCHAKLTPRSLLTKMGLRKSNPELFFYSHFNKISEAGETVDFIDVCDYLENYVFPLLKD